jgi:hypothetical protein
MPLARRPIRRLLPALLIACLSAHAAAGQGSTLEERMSYKEFTGYGLDKLSPEQLRGLNDWLHAHEKAADCTPGAAPATVPGSAAAARADGAEPPPPPARAVPDKISSRIAGEFSGWKQGQIIVLANGQRWEVRDEEPFYTSGERQPRVTVEPSFLSGWTLTVEGHSEIAHVVPASKH